MQSFLSENGPHRGPNIPAGPVSGSALSIHIPCKSRIPCACARHIFVSLFWKRYILLKPGIETTRQQPTLSHPTKLLGPQKISIFSDTARGLQRRTPTGPMAEVPWQRNIHQASGPHLVQRSPTRLVLSPRNCSFHDHRDWDLGPTGLGSPRLQVPGTVR